MAIKSKLLLSLSLFSLIVLSALATQDPELRHCKQQCGQKRQLDQRQKEQCKQGCEEYYREKQRREKEGGRGEGQGDNIIELPNPERPEERLRECERRCEQGREGEQQKRECRQDCQEEYRREKERERERERPNPERQPEERLRECERRCKQGREGEQQKRECSQDCQEEYRREKERERERERERPNPERQPEERLRECERRCEQGREREQQKRECRQDCQDEYRREKEREGRDHMYNEEREEEEREEEWGPQQQQERNPYVFEDQHFTQKIGTEHGRLRILQKFTERSKLLRGIENYRLAILEANPQTFFLPHHHDAEVLLYVAQGRGVITLVCEDNRESFNIERGHIMRVRAGTTVYGINRDRNEKLVVLKLLQPVGIPGHFELFFGAGGESPESFFKAFSPEILETAFNTRRERLEKLFGQQKQGIIVKASEEQIRSMSQQGEEGGGGGGGGRQWPFGGVETKKGPFNLLKQRPSFSNQYGRHYEVNVDECKELLELDIALSFDNITQGAMEVPLYHSRATTISIVTDGEGYMEMACPHLSSSSEREHGGSQGQGQGPGPSYKKMSTRLRRGMVLIVPAGHPYVLVASGNQNLEMVSFEINAKNNRNFPLAGKKNIVNQLEKEAKELAFKVPAREVDEVFTSQEGEWFVKGPRHQGRAYT